MTANDDRERHVCKLVRGYLAGQARAVDGRSFVARLRQPRRSERRWLLIRLVPLAAAAAILVAAILIFQHPSPRQAPPMPPVSDIVRSQGSSILGGALTGLSAAHGCLKDAAAVGELSPSSLTASLPAPSTESIEALKSDARTIGESLRRILDQALSNAGLAS